MIVTNKLYRKDFNQYSEDDWKYIFSIYTLRDKYNFTEEAFLSLELTGKITMLKKMDESLYVWGEFDDAMHDDESVFAPCPEDEGCKVIQDFLEDEDVKDHIHSPEDALKDFLDEEIDEIAIIKNQWDLAFKDRERLLTIIRFIDEQSKNAYADLDAVHKTINDLDERYYKYKQKNPQWQ
jgi:hypothetical protein